MRIIVVPTKLSRSVFAALSGGRWCSRRRRSRRLLRILLGLLVFLLLVVLEEEEREHAQDAADADADGFTLDTCGEKSHVR